MDQQPQAYNVPPQLHAPRATSGLAIASLVTSLTCLAPAAIICGHMALSRIRKSGGQLGGYGMALAGLIIGYVTIPLICLQLLSVLFVGARAWKRGADRAQCLIQQRNITAQLQVYCAQKGLKPGDAIPLDEALPPDTITTCPDGGNLEITKTVPEDGEPYVFCPDPKGHDHSPQSATTSGY